MRQNSSAPFSTKHAHAGGPSTRPAWCSGAPRCAIAPAAPRRRPPPLPPTARRRATRRQAARKALRAPGRAATAHERQTSALCTDGCHHPVPCIILYYHLLLSSTEIQHQDPCLHAMRFDRRQQHALCALPPFFPLLSTRRQAAFCNSNDNPPHLLMRFSRAITYTHNSVMLQEGCCCCGGAALTSRRLIISLSPQAPQRPPQPPLAPAWPHHACAPQSCSWEGAYSQKKKGGGGARAYVVVKVCVRPGGTPARSSDAVWCCLFFFSSFCMHAHTSSNQRAKPL